MRVDGRGWDVYITVQDITQSAAEGHLVPQSFPIQ